MLLKCVKNNKFNAQTRLITSSPVKNLKPTKRDKNAATIGNYHDIELQYPYVSDVTFDSTAFDSWKFSKLFRNWLVFKSCGIEPLVDNSQKIMDLSYKYLKPIFLPIMKATYYGQFVAGNTPAEIKNTTEELLELGIEPFIAMPIETESQAGCDIETWQNEVQEKIIYCIKLVGETKGYRPTMTHIKLSGIIDHELQLKLTEKIGRNVTSSVLFEKFLDDLVSLMKNGDWGSNTLQKELTEKEQEHLKLVAKRLNEIGHATVDQDIVLQCDAEYVNMNPTLTLMTLALACCFNTSTKPYFWNTYQCYLKNTPAVVEYEFNLLKDRNVAFGAKCVRGAYMDSERARAKIEGLESPVCDTIEATHENYNNVVQSLLRKLNRNEHLQFLIASHNEETVNLALKTIEKYASKNKKFKHESVRFAQLYGMCDHVSGTLANLGVPVYKSMPIGPVEDVMPYLARRAQENKTVLNANHREKNLLWNALKTKINPLN